jgi:hypothetical protein
MATALEPGAEPEEISSTELTDLGLNRIAYSIAISLKRLADATEEMTVIAAAPKPEIITHDDGWRDSVTRALHVLDPGNADFTAEGYIDSRTYRPAVYANIGELTRDLIQSDRALNPSTKTTSPEMAALAAKYMGLNDEELNRLLQPDVDADHDTIVRLYADIRSLAACVLSQADPKTKGDLENSKRQGQS